jgi:TRAP-type uncharacterized transport system substrate-binding protein
VTAPGTNPDGPTIDRTLTLHWKADWGAANLVRVCGWLAQEVGDRAGVGTRSAIWTGRGFVDNVLAVVNGEVDLALATPGDFVTMATRGIGPYEGSAHPNLRALGTVPQTDCLIAAVGADVAAELGVSSFAAWREAKAGLRVATGLDDGVNHVGMAAAKIMEYHGVGKDELERWGGSVSAWDRPDLCTELYRTGAADVILQEAVMAPYWSAAVEERPTVFLPMEEPVLARLHDELGWSNRVLPAGYLPTQEQDVLALDFSDFLLITTDTFPEDVAYLITWCLVHTREAIERQYRHVPVNRSSITYPLDPAKMRQTTIALHPGAARFYDEYEAAL